MAHAREHAVLAAPTSSRCDAIQSSGEPEALHNRCTATHVLGVLALGTALDGACSEARRSNRSNEFPFWRDPKLRQAGSTPNRYTAIRVFGVLALGTALDGVCSGARHSSRSNEFPFWRDPKLRQAGSTP